MKYIVSILFAFIVCNLYAQQSYINKKGGYQITAPARWTVEQENEITSVYAADEGEMDTWKEKLEISLMEANDLNLEEGFEFYIKEDLPAMYKSFAIVRHGEEVINGVKTKWAIFSFAGSGTVGTTEISFTLYNLFYLAHKDKTFFMLNGIAEKDYYSKLESDFLQIVRSFQLVK